MKAAGFALAGSALTFFGLMHGEAIGIGQSPVVALSYLSVAAVLVACAKYAAIEAKPPEHEEAPHGPLPEPAE
jgi:AGZA family xanthine/uracil permease-like MFS transporter